MKAMWSKFSTGFIVYSLGSSLSVAALAAANPLTLEVVCTRTLGKRTPQGAWKEGSTDSQTPSTLMATDDRAGSFTTHFDSCNVSVNVTSSKAGNAGEREHTIILTRYASELFTMDLFFPEDLKETRSAYVNRRYQTFAPGATSYATLVRQNEQGVWQQEFSNEAAFPMTITLAYQRKPFSLGKKHWWEKEVMFDAEINCRLDLIGDAAAAAEPKA